MKGEGSQGERELGWRKEKGGNEEEGGRGDEERLMPTGRREWLERKQEWKREAVRVE